MCSAAPSIGKGPSVQRPLSGDCVAKLFYGGARQNFLAVADALSPETMWGVHMARSRALTERLSVRNRINHVHRPHSFRAERISDR